MGATYPFVTLTVHDGADISRLTSYSGPPDIYNLLTRKYTGKQSTMLKGPIGYRYGKDSIPFNSCELFETQKEYAGSRLIGVRIWSHKYLHGFQLVYRKPKIAPNVPSTAEELWKELDARGTSESLEDPQKIDEKVEEREWTSPIYGVDSGPQVKMYEFNIGDNEYLTDVEIDYSAVLMCIRLRTNRDRSVSIGTAGGTTHKFTAHPSSAIVGFHGFFGPWDGQESSHIHMLGVILNEIHPQITGDCDVLRLMGNYTYRLKEVIAMNENRRFYIFKFQDIDNRAIQRKECLI